MAEIPVNIEGAEQIKSAFISAATWHGTLDIAEAMLAEHPWLAGNDIAIAAIMGDDETVSGLLAADAGNASIESGPYGTNALVYLCLSKYLRLDEKRSGNFLRAAKALLQAGASANSGFWSKGQYPEFETALYGAAGVAHHAELTRLLLEHGADPNDEEACYHSPETYDNGAMRELVQTGKVTAANLSMMLLRKADWHDYDGAKYLLEFVDPNVEKKPGWKVLHHSLARNNSIEIIKLLLDHGADPSVSKHGLTAIGRAAYEGRGDVLELLEQRGISTELSGADKLIAACAKGDAEDVESIISAEPVLVEKLREKGGTLLAKFAGTGNLAGVIQLLDIGVDVNAPFVEGDGYFGIPAGSLAIHVAAWRGHPPVVKLLIERGSLVNVPDANGRTPLALAVRACVDSYWSARRTPASVEALLNAGAQVTGLPFPTGYAEVDALLAKHGDV